MRRLARRLFTLCSAVSLVLFVAVCVLWAVTRSTGYECSWSATGAAGAAGGTVNRWSAAFVGHGGLWCAHDVEFKYPPWAEDGAAEAGEKAGGKWRFKSEPAPDYPVIATERGAAFLPISQTFVNHRPVDRWGFVLEHTRVADERYPGDPPSRFIAFSLPLWFVAAAFAALPVVWCVRHDARRRRAARAATGLCPSCSYDLRASPGRCPECGTAATATAEPPAAPPG